MDVHIKWAVALLVVTLVIPQSTVIAQPPSQKMDSRIQKKIREVVDACVVYVRKEVEAQYPAPPPIPGINTQFPQFKSGFNAYTKPDGSVAYFGTNQERFLFEKCLNDSGPIK
jgi:hypothetical protein